MALTARSAARALGLKRYFTGKPCVRGHISERRVADKNCVDCRRERKQSAPDREAARNHYLRNREKVRQAVKLWYAARPGANARKNARRRAATMGRTPPWLNQAHLVEIEGVYQLARVMSQITGQGYHVDHIVPLRGTNVSGLHAPWNLQVLRAADNLKKSNRVQSEGHPDLRNSRPLP